MTLAQLKTQQPVYDMPEMGSDHASGRQRANRGRSKSYAELEPCLDIPSCKADSFARASAALRTARACSDLALEQTQYIIVRAAVVLPLCDLRGRHPRAVLLSGLCALLEQHLDCLRIGQLGCLVEWERRCG